MKRKRVTLSDALKTAIAESGESVNAIAQATGVEQATLSRFTNHHQDILLANAEKLAAHFRLELKPMKTEPKQALPELFGKSIPMKGGGHADCLAPEVVEKINRAEKAAKKKKPPKKGR